VISVLLSGHGRMGQCLEGLIREAPDLTLAGVLEPGDASPPPHADAVVDFSHPDFFPRAAEYARRNQAVLISGTTGLSPTSRGLLAELGKEIPVLWSANFSTGIAVLEKAAAEIAGTLPDFDIEILETHHNRKEDAPSGTAKLLLEAVDPGHSHIPVYGREGRPGPRDPREIGIHSLRGGTVAGTHTILFLGPGEVLEITHRAAGREVFAQGALRALRALMGRPRGMYTLENLLMGGESQK
jgi:4-hydroxy-tetrahydrodipicolinate reductase